MSGAERAAALDAAIREFLTSYRAAAEQARRAYAGTHRQPPDPRYPSITCPVCSWTSYHPDDKRHGYCGNCNDFTTPTGGNPPAPIS